MRIVYFTDTFRPMLNGIVTSIESFVRELADRGHEILVIVPDHAGIDFVCPGVEILTVKGFPAFFYPDFKVTFGFTPTLIRKIRAFQPDLIHFHTQFVLGWQAIVLGKLLKIPRVGTFHTYIADDGYLKVLGVENFKIFGEIGWKYNNFFYEHCETVIAPSENAARELVDHGIESEKIHVVANPAPVTGDKMTRWQDDKMKDGRAVIASETKWSAAILGGDSSDKIAASLSVTADRSSQWRNNTILYIGRISPEKSLSVCLDAIYIVSREIPDVRFVIVGDGPDREAMESYAREIGISDRVDFLGRIEHDVLLASDIFDRSRLFLTASATETQGITLLEAMSRGLPVVGVDAKGVGEIIEDNGYKARVGNAGELALYCIRILRDEQLRAKLSERSRELVMKYDVRLLTDRLENIYMETAQRGPRKK